MKTLAAIAQAPGEQFVLDHVDIDAPRDDEILVRIHAVGICHTDIAVRDQHLPLPLPAVLGHEGAGIVEAVGAAVTKVAPGDRVALTFMSCGTCPSCRQNAPSACVNFNAANGTGHRADGSCALHHDGAPLTSDFFGQSSFAGLAISHERNTIRIPETMPLELAGPFGCGVQTGAGAILRSLNCQADRSLLIIGGGTVGLSALLAAVTRHCAPIIVSEPSAERRELALELGATHAIDPSDGGLEDQARQICPEGLDYAFDSSGRVDAIEAAIELLTFRGTLALVGMPTVPNVSFSTRLYGLIARSGTIKGVVEGDSDPDHFIPELMQLFLDGLFPIEKLVRTYPFSAINQAVADQLNGQCVKAVLTL